MSKKGAVIINAFGIPGQTVHQAQRLKEEFIKKGVEIDILSQAFLRVQIGNDNIINDLERYDFIVYLDKDKYLLHLLDKLNVKTFNSHKSISVCDDKGETYIELSGKGFNLPKTQFAPLCYSQECEISEQYVISLEQNIGYPMIAKSSYGSCGSGVYKIDNRKELIKIMQQLKTIPHMYQQYLGKHVGKDIRVIVIGGKAVASMQRYNPNDFRSNLALGGVGTKIEVNDKKYAKVISTSQKVSKVLGLDYCGVDILLGDDDKPYICEVNSNAFFEGIEKVTSVNVAEKYVEHILNNI